MSVTGLEFWVLEVEVWIRCALRLARCLPDNYPGRPPVVGMDVSLGEPGLWAGCPGRNASERLYIRIRERDKETDSVRESGFRIGGENIFEVSLLGINHEPILQAENHNHNYQ